MAKPYSINRTKFLTEIELAELYRILKNDSVNRNSLIIRVALATGARATEILNLTRLDFFEANKSLFFRGLKGSNDREIPLPNDLYKDIKSYLQTVQGERLFPIAYWALNRMWHFYRPGPKKFHALRHTFALELYKKTKDIRLVQLALGHRNIQSTEIYMSFIYSIEQMRKLLCA